MGKRREHQVNCLEQEKGLEDTWVTESYYCVGRDGTF